MIDRIQEIKQILTNYSLEHEGWNVLPDTTFDIVARQICQHEQARVVGLFREIEEEVFPNFTSAKWQALKAQEGG